MSAEYLDVTEKANADLGYGKVEADGSVLNMRSGPGTTHAAIATLWNGNSITVVADAGDGWYQINFSGQGGAATTGYIRGEYISTN